MLALVACTVGLHKVDRDNRVNGKENTSIYFIHEQGGDALSQMYFQFLLLHHAGLFENLGESKIHQNSWQMGRDVKFA